MAQLSTLADAIQRGRHNVPFTPARIGRHEVLIENLGFGAEKTFVYRIRNGRVTALLAGPSYREDLASALLDAVDDLVDADDLGSTVHLRPLDVPGVALDRAALFGPGYTGFFDRKPEFADCGLQVVPVHSSEVDDGADIDAFVRGRIFGKNLGIDEKDWSRAPVPAARVLRLDHNPGGLYRPTRKARNMSKPVAKPAQELFERDLPEMFHGPEEISVHGVHGQELRLRRGFDRLLGTLRLPGDDQPMAVDAPIESGWELFSTLFHTGEFDPATLAAAARRPATPMLDTRIRNRYRDDTEPWRTTLDSALLWIEKMEAHAGHSLHFTGRSGGCVQLIWHSDGGEPELSMDTAQPGRQPTPARRTTRAEAAQIVRVLAHEDRLTGDKEPAR
ncbi:hypothetical protein [Nocardia sp. NPDC051832]|uniref:hypothetical protein n=1 Tax=Nocardia sp. NPDC051832 TaxID=3155673 RepID=UPI0034409291